MPRAYGVTNAAPYASAPAVGAAGDTYFNTTNKMMFLSDGTSWIQIQGGTGIPQPLDDGFTRYGSGTWASSSGVIVDLRLSNIAVAYGNTYTGNANLDAFTIPITGLYDLSGTLSSNAAVFLASSFLAIRVNGIVMVRQTANKQDAYETINVAIQRFLTAGDVVSLSFYQAGGTFNRASVSQNSLDPYSPMLSVWRAGTGLQGPQGLDGMPGSAANIGGYWFGQQVTPTGSVLNNDVAQVYGWTTARSNGFTLQSSGQRITPTASGRYKVTAELSWLSATNASAYCRAVITHFNSIGAVVASVNGLGNGAAIATYCEAVIDGVFDMVVGDYLQITGSINNAAATHNPNNVWCTVVPVGGAKGDTGATGLSGTAVAVPPPYYAARASVAPATVTSAAAVQVVLDTLIETNASGDFTLSAGAITVNSDGYYQIVGQVLLPSSVTSTSRYWIIIARWDGISQWIAGASDVEQVSSTVGNGAPLGTTWETWLTAGSRIALLIYSNDGTGRTWSLITTPTQYQPYAPQLAITKAGGAKGDQGTAGLQGPAGTTAQSLTARGEWNSATAYNPTEIVTKNGVAFLAMAANSNVDPGAMPAGSFAAISDVLAQVNAVGKLLPWTPVFRQPTAALPCTVNAGWFARVGEWVIAEFQVTFTGSGTAGQNLGLDLPVPIRAPTNNAAVNIGSAYLYTGANTYSIEYQSGGNNTQIFFAVGTNYWSTQIVSGHSATGFMVYPAPVGV